MLKTGEQGVSDPTCKQEGIDRVGDFFCGCCKYVGEFLTSFAFGEVSSSFESSGSVLSRDPVNECTTDGVLRRSSPSQRQLDAECNSCTPLSPAAFPANV